MEFNDQYIEISDGLNTKKLLLLDTFGVEENDYAALLDEDEEALYFFEIEMNDEEAVFNPIEDESELNEILAIYAELLEEDEEN